MVIVAIGYLRTGHSVIIGPSVAWQGFGGVGG